MQPEQLGPYHLQRPIATGGMANVFLARNGETGQLVAIKVLSAALAREEGFVDRFQREITALKTLHNEHIVQVYEEGQLGETYYYAMEFVDGETLTQRIRDRQRLAWREALSITRQLCIALKAAHDAGIIHRDLKPSNILLTSAGTVKLTDFGVAQLYTASKLTQTGAVVGTAEYMSPEQAAGQRVTRRSDLYSLGAVLYCMLVGKPPFTGNSTVDVLQKHRHSQFDPPRSFVDDIPSWLDELVVELLAKDPQQRPPDAYQVRRRIDQIFEKVALKQDEPARSPDETRVDTQQYQAPTSASTKMRNQARDGGLARHEPTVWESIFNGPGFWGVVLVALLLAVGYSLWPRQIDDETRFEEGIALLRDPTPEQWTKAVNDVFKPLSNRSDDWKRRVTPYLEQAARQTLENRVISRARHRNRSVTPDEQWLRRAWDLREQGKLPEAIAVLDAVRTAAGADPEMKLSGLLAAEWSQEWQQPDPHSTEVVTRLNALQATADAERAAHPDRAKRLLRAIVILGNSTAATLPQAAAAQRQLDELIATEPSR